MEVENQPSRVSDVEFGTPEGTHPRLASPPVRQISLLRLFLACAVAGGIQFGWALQLSLLTPYVQTLGLSHTLSSFVWLCGPVAGFIVQPCIGLTSDRCRSRFGRRRPFIVAGCILICIAVFLIGFSSDIGYALGDTKEHCSVYNGRRMKAAAIYVFGFWVLDFSNNTVQGPTRALMADISGQHGCSAANSIFCLWMGFGNILGYASGSTGEWHRWFPFLMTKACCADCANLKGAFLISAVLLLITMIVTIIFAQEVPLPALSCRSEDPNKTSSENQDTRSNEQAAGLIAIFKHMKNLPRGMLPVLIMTALTWLAWFPFSLYNTNWMGREIYHGRPKGTKAEEEVFNEGVQDGAFGLLLNAVVLTITSFLVVPLCRRLTARIVWIASNSFMGLGLIGIAITTKWSMAEYMHIIPHVIGANHKVKAVALALFSILGIPLAIIFSIPFAVMAQLAATEGGGQGLCTGVLNISIVIPQVICSLGLGYWSKLFSKGESDVPGFVLGAIVAFLSSIMGFFILPKLSRSNFRSSGTGGH